VTPSSNFGYIYLAFVMEAMGYHTALESRKQC